VAHAVVSYETIAGTMAWRCPDRGEHLTGSRRIRHEPTALEMRHIFADEPSRRFPGAFLALTGDPLDSAFLADIVIPKRDESARRCNFDTEESSAAAYAWLGAAAAPKSASRTRPLRVAHVALLAFALHLPLHSPFSCAASMRAATILKVDLLVLENSYASLTRRRLAIEFASVRL
jgi:hypothetical protein